MRRRVVQPQHAEFHPSGKFRGSLCICQGTLGQTTDATMFTARNLRCSDARRWRVFLKVCIRNAPKGCHPGVPSGCSMSAARLCQ